MIVQNIVYSNFSNRRFGITKAEGSYLWDDAGNKLLDFTSGWNVTNLGWNHPEVNEAFIRQANKTVYVPFWTADPIQEELATALLDAYPGMEAAIRTTGGTEAVEVAVKLSRAATGRTKIIGFKNTYHGQLFASMALGYLPEYVKKISPMVPDFVQLDYPAAVDHAAKDQATLDAFKKHLDDALQAKDVAAIFVEPGIVTGWGACQMAPAGFMEYVREATTKYGTLMVVDEVGTGFSRTGALFGINHFDVVPDVAVFAKGITNGAGGLGAVLSRKELIEPTIPHANYTSTFGWTPTSCAGALATLQIHKRDKVWERSRDLGKPFIEGLRQKLLPLGAVVRGRGMIACVDLTACTTESDAARKIEQAAYKNGLSLITDAQDVLVQLMPPCTSTKKELQTGADILVDAVRQVVNK